MKYKKLTTFPEHLENPFIEEAVQNINVVKKTQTIRAKNKEEIQMIVSGDEVTGHSAFMRFVEVDEEKFAKLYLSQLSALWDLSKPSIRVFSYILTKLVPKKSDFYFQIEDCLEYTKYSSANSVLTGMSELIEAGIIARTRYHYQYFINPLIVFNGDRVTFAKTYIKKKKDKELSQKPISQLDLFKSKDDSKDIA
jgi:intergrase/recombinase